MQAFDPSRVIRRAALLLGNNAAWESPLQHEPRMGHVEVEALLLDGALISGDRRRLERCLRAAFEATQDARL